MVLNCLMPFAVFVRIVIAVAGAGMVLQTWSLEAQPTIQIDPPSPKIQGLFGSTVCGVPDLDGDGYGDVIIGAYNEPVSRLQGAGCIYVYSGATGAFLRAIVSPHAMVNGRLADGMRGIPDVDGDGRGDILTAARQEHLDGLPIECGVAYVFSGATGAVIHEIVSPNAEEGGHFGDSTGTVRDLDGDGIDDLLINADRENPGSSPADAGRGYLFSGRTAALIYTFTSPNEEVEGLFASNIDGIPDVNGDGKDDIILPANGESVGGFKSAGRVYIFSGATGLPLREVNAPNPQLNGLFGWADWGFSDIIGDGRGDMILGAPQETPPGQPNQAGRAYIISGADGAVIQTLISPYPSELGWFGFAVSALPDFDGDSKSDVIVGARFEWDGGVNQAGHAYIYSSRTGGLQKMHRSPNVQPGGQFGIAVDAIPNGAGSRTGDFVVGSIEVVGDKLAAGRTYLYLFPSGIDDCWTGYE